MPVYEYDCRACGGFTALRPMAQFREPQPCPACGSLADRAIFSAPGLPLLNDRARSAYATNERSAHAPKISTKSEREAGNRHGPGCACCKAGAGTAKIRVADDGAKSFPGKRPWMISH